jgi:hypothetical protein
MLINNFAGTSGTSDSTLRDRFHQGSRQNVVRHGANQPADKLPSTSLHPIDAMTDRAASLNKSSLSRSRASRGNSSTNDDSCPFVTVWFTVSRQFPDCLREIKSRTLEFSSAMNGGLN